MNLAKMDSGRLRQPLVSVGFPLYNNARTIERAFDAIRRQTWQNLEIVISDDCSEDETFSICEKLAATEPRTRIFRQLRNLYYQNFRFLLERSRGEFFMWAAGDDFWRPRFIEANLEVLMRSPDVVGSVSRCLFVRNKRRAGTAVGTFALMGSPAENVEKFLRSPADNTRMYGVFRRSVLLSAFPESNFHAYDWALSAGTLRWGKHYEVANILMRRDKTLLENYVRSVERDHCSPIYRYFPVLRMTMYLLLRRRIPLTGGILRALVKLNYKKHCEYMRLMRQGLFRRLTFLYLFLDKHIIWRL